MTKEFIATLTQEEKDAASYLDLSNETLGRCVKEVAKLIIDTDSEGKGALFTATAGQLLLKAAIESNADELTMDFKGHTYKDSHKADWEIIVRKK